MPFKKKNSVEELFKNTVNNNKSSRDYRPSCKAQKHRFRKFTVKTISNQRFNMSNQIDQNIAMMQKPCK